MKKHKVFEIMLEKDVPELTEEEKKTIHEYEEKGIVRRTEFETEEEKEAYVKWLKKSRYYMKYFLLGIGLNFLFYHLGMNHKPEIIYSIATNTNLGFFLGIGVPMAVMFGGVELHFKIKEIIKRNQARN